MTSQIPLQGRPRNPTQITASMGHIFHLSPLLPFSSPTSYEATTHRRVRPTPPTAAEVYPATPDLGCLATFLRCRAPERWGIEGLARGGEVGDAQRDPGGGVVLSGPPRMAARTSYHASSSLKKLLLPTIPIQIAA
jgi:hypothetical protein